MLYVAMKKYPKTMEKIENRYLDLNNLYNTLSMADRLANEVLSGLPKEEQIKLKESNDKLLKCVKKGLNKYKIANDNIEKIFHLVQKGELIANITNTKITFSRRR